MEVIGEIIGLRSKVHVSGDGKREMGNEKGSRFPFPVSPFPFKDLLLSTFDFRRSI
jgi:hypothetical protein